MLVELVDYTNNPEERIANYAAICYHAKTDKESNARRVKHLLKLGHLSTLRFAYAVFRVSGISRACANQLVRSKHLDYLQESQRYVKQTNATFVVPDHPLANKLSGAYQSAMARYEELLEEGMKKEDARLVLPLGITTQLYVSGNFQAWKDFIKLRTDSAAQWEIRKVAREIQKDLSMLAPNIFDDEDN